MSHPPSERWRFRACGIGVIGNQGERAKGIVCTELNYADATNCKETAADASTTVFPVKPDQTCFVWPDRDNNVCVGKKMFKIKNYNFC
jgi:hypothetical protein